MTQAAALGPHGSPAPYVGNIISAESYLSEPPDLWQQALPEQWRRQGPRVASGPHGDQFEIAGAPPRSLGLRGPLAHLQRIGVSIGPGYGQFHYADHLAPAAYDGSARVVEQRQNGLTAEVIYPTLGLLISTAPDPQLQQLCCRIYNNWLAEFCAADPHRLRGMALLPAKCDIEQIVAEIEHVARLGLAGVVLPARHTVAAYNMPQWDAAWDAIQAHGLICSIHLGPEEGAVLSPQGAGAGGILLSTGKYELNDTLQMVVWGGAMMRFPGLRVGLVGSGAGWLATQLTFMDHWWHDHKGWMEPRLAQAPSRYWYQQGFATFQDDGPAVATRDIIGVNNLLWGIGTRSSAADELVGAALSGLPDADAQAIASGNAARLFGITAVS